MHKMFLVITWNFAFDLCLMSLENKGHIDYFYSLIQSSNMHFAYFTLLISAAHHINDSHNHFAQVCDQLKLSPHSHLSMLLNRLLTNIVHPKYLFGKEPAIIK